MCVALLFFLLCCVFVCWSCVSSLSLRCIARCLCWFVWLVLSVQLLFVLYVMVELFVVVTACHHFCRIYVVCLLLCLVGVFGIIHSVCRCSVRVIVLLCLLSTTVDCSSCFICGVYMCLLFGRVLLRLACVLHVSLYCWLFRRVLPHGLCVGQSLLVVRVACWSYAYDCSIVVNMMMFGQS